ncbi:MAG: hypothetical protein K2X47_08785 [Bdellovibrionales bacterium]|nr:hypothetical protein [Bdellovibrionales bacterium]
MKIEPSIKNVLWIRVGALGDLLIATAGLSETLLRFPNAKISLLGPKIWTDLIDPQLFPRIDRVFVPAENNQFQVWRTRNLPSQKAQWVFAEKVQDPEVWPQFQAVVNHRIESLRYAIPAWRAGVPMRIGSGHWWTRFLFTHWSPDLGKDPAIHERDWHLRVATATETWRFLDGISVAENRKALSQDRGFGLDADVWSRWQRTGLPQLRKPDAHFSEARWGLKPKSFFLMNPTSSRREKAWPSSKYRELILAWKKESWSEGLEPVVVGAPSETDWLREVAGREFRMIQPQSVAELFHLVGSARGLLTNASSMHFIAASTKTPALVLMGRSDPRIWGPLGSEKLVVQQIPASYASRDIFAQETEAYQNISIREVVAQLAQLLKISKVD